MVRIDPTLLLPHAGPARLLGGVVERTADGIACEVRIPASSPYVTESRCSPFILIEAAAQAAAAFLASELERPPSAGYLVRARTVTFARPEVAIGGRLVARARRTGAAPPLHLFEVEVRAETQSVLRGEIGVYVESGSATGG